MARRKPVARPARQLQQTTLFGFAESSSPPTRRHTQRRNRTPPHIVREKSSEQDDSDVGAIAFEPKLVDLTDEDELYVSPPKKRRARVARGRTESPASAAEVVVTPAEQSEPEEEEIVPPPRKGKGMKRNLIHDSDSEDLRPQKRKLVKGVRPPSPEEDDMLDDVDNDKILNTRLRIRGKKSAYQKSLDKLRRNRGRVNGISEPESTTSDDGDDNDDDDDDGEEDGPIIPFKGAKPDDGVDSDAKERESEDDDFIVEDDGAVPVELPVDFSMSTHQDFAHHFKIICQFFVHLAIRPPAERGDLMDAAMKGNQYVSLPLQIARRKITGLRDSVASSVWQKGFRDALEKYPDFELVHLNYALASCDACHLAGRLSTLLGRLDGTPYDKWGFENSSDSGDNNTKEFHLGRFCAKRTAAYHNLCHWEYALFKYLCREVDELRSTSGNRGFVRVAYANGIQPPDDLSDADGIMDWLDQRQIIDIGWHRLKDVMESATTLEMAKRNGEEND